MAAPTYGTNSQFASNSQSFGVAALDATHYAIGYYDANAGSLKVVIASISGTTISYGTPVVVGIAANSRIRITALDSSHVVVMYQDSSSGGTYAACASVSGTTPTFGTPVDMSNTAGTGGSFRGICKLDSTHFVVGYRNAGTGNSFVNVGLVSLGTTITAGTPLTFGAGDPATNSNIELVGLDSTHYAVGYHLDATSTNKAFVCSITALVSTKGSDVAWTTTNGSTDFSFFPIDSTHFGIAQHNNSGEGSAYIAITSGTTISSYGTPAQFSATATRIGSALIDSTHFILSYSNGTNGENIVGTISGGTTIAYGTSALFDSTDNVSSSNLSSPTAVLDTTHFVVAWQRSSAGTSVSIIGQPNISAASAGNFFLVM